MLFFVTSVSNFKNIYQESDMNKPKYLTKSRFKLGCECESKLFYTRKKEYADQSSDNPFLMELAKGGYQVGELAKYYFYEDRPVPTVETLGYEDSLAETNLLIENGEEFIAEAAVRFQDLFVRVDIFQINRTRKSIRFYEVKAKSCRENEEFIKVPQRGPNEGIPSISTSWEPYLFDAAFQKYVIQNAFPGYTVNAFLMLINKDAVATVDGLNQFFKIKGDTNTFEIYTEEGLAKAQLGSEVLLKVAVDEEVNLIWNSPVESSAFGAIGFDDYIEKLSTAYKEDQKIVAPISKACKSCQFFAKPGQELEGYKSGQEECWRQQLDIDKTQFEKAKVTEIWGGLAGAKSVVQHLLDQEKYFIEDVEETNLPGKPNGSDGLSPYDRRTLQVRFVKEHDTGFYFDKAGFKAEMNQWTFPLHFIDFETASPALPFTQGAHPYEGIAFQFSHHTMDRHGKIEHKTQFLETTRGKNPNIKFVKALKDALSSDNGTIFRYHNHENSYLRMIRNQLYGMSEESVENKADLLAFIDDITQHKVDGHLIEGNRNMVDMYKLVIQYYYSPHAKGSNSLKYILPAAIHDSDYLQEKYSRPICGMDKEVTSLNFETKIWIDPVYNNDPYKVLPKVFEGYDRQTLDDLFSGMDEVADGGAAMMAYAKLQFFDTPDDQREAIRKALLKYCELDTLAMVMLMEFWFNELEK
jgi:hypothetical protein